MATDEQFDPHRIEVGAENIKEAQEAIVRSMQLSFAMWGMSFEVVRNMFEEFAKRQQEQMRSTITELNGAIQSSNSDERTTAISDILVSQMEKSIKSFAEAGLKSMAYAGAYSKKFDEEIKATLSERTKRETATNMEAMQNVMSRSVFGVQPEMRTATADGVSERRNRAGGAHRSRRPARDDA